MWLAPILDGVCLREYPPRIQSSYIELRTDNETQAVLINERAFPGVCPIGQVVMNTTNTSGVECIIDLDTWNTTVNHVHFLDTLVHLDILLDSSG